MKRACLSLIVITIISILSSCQKDENGNRISYYKNKTGEGYVFFKFGNDSITPIRNSAVEIISYGKYTGYGELFAGRAHHTNIVYTGNNYLGKYS